MELHLNTMEVVSFDHLIFIIIDLQKSNINIHPSTSLSSKPTKTNIDSLFHTSLAIVSHSHEIGKPIVLITINYRLNSLGFVSHPSSLWVFLSHTHTHTKLYFTFIYLFIFFKSVTETQKHLRFYISSLTLTLSLWMIYRLDSKIRSLPWNGFRSMSKPLVVIQESECWGRMNCRTSNSFEVEWRIISFVFFFTGGQSWVVGEWETCLQKPFGWYVGSPSGVRAQVDFQSLYIWHTSLNHKTSLGQRSWTRVRRRGK